MKEGSSLGANQRTSGYKKSTQSSQADVDDKWGHNMYTLIIEEEEQQKTETYSNSHKEDYPPSNQSYYQGYGNKQDNQSNYNKGYGYQGFDRGFQKYKGGNKWQEEMQSHQSFNQSHHHNKKHGKKKNWQNEGGYQKYGDQGYNQDKYMGQWGMKNPHQFYHQNHYKNMNQQPYQNQHPHQHHEGGMNKKRSMQQQQHQQQHPQHSQHHQHQPQKKEKEKETISVILEQEIDKNQIYPFGLLKKEGEDINKDDQISTNSGQHRKIQYNNNDEKDGSFNYLFTLNMKFNAYSLQIGVRDNETPSDVVFRYNLAQKYSKDLVEAIEIFIGRKLEQLKGKDFNSNKKKKESTHQLKKGHSDSPQHFSPKLELSKQGQQIIPFNNGPPMPHPPFPQQQMMQGPQPIDGRQQQNFYYYQGQNQQPPPPQQHPQQIQHRNQMPMVNQLFDSFQKQFPPFPIMEHLQNSQQTNVNFYHQTGQTIVNQSFSPNFPGQYFPFQGNPMLLGREGPESFPPQEEYFHKYKQNLDNKKKGHQDFEGIERGKKSASFTQAHELNQPDFE